jgi:hypothetical protein
VAAADAERRQLERKAGQLQDLRGQAVLAATTQRLELAERVVRRLATERHPALESGARERVRSLDARIASAASELERHRLAVDAYDQPAYRRGLLVALGALGAVVTLLVVAVILTRPEPPPKPPPSEFDQILEGRDAGRPSP